MLQNSLPMTNQIWNSSANELRNLKSLQRIALRPSNSWRKRLSLLLWSLIKQYQEQHQLSWRIKLAKPLFFQFNAMARMLLGKMSQLELIRFQSVYQQAMSCLRMHRLWPFWRIKTTSQNFLLSLRPNCCNCWLNKLTWPALLSTLMQQVKNV